MIMASILCPQCGKDDQIRKVTSIVTEGSTTVNYTDSLGTLGGSGSAFHQTQLAKRLIPPSKPKLTGCAATSPVVIFMVGVVLSSILFCVLFPSLAWSSGSNIWATCIFIALMLAVIAAINVPIGIYSVKKQKELKPQIAMWEKAISKWQQSYYCARCDGIFTPNQNKIVSPEEMTTFLYQ
jgi:hypothetical protein